MTREPLTIVYDGACPFCSSYVRFVRLKRNYDVKLVDARSHRPQLDAYHRLGFNLNEGMVVEVGENLYHGAEPFRSWPLSPADPIVGTR